MFFSPKTEVRLLTIISPIPTNEKKQYIWNLDSYFWFSSSSDSSCWSNNSHLEVVTAEWKEKEDVIS